jgi:hypothetical protein
MEEDMSKPWPRDYNMPKVDPDKEDETEHVAYTDEEGILPEFKIPDPNKGIVYLDEGSELDWGYIEIVLPSKDAKVVSCHTPKTCNHEWKHYIGLSEQFDYCVHCDEKRK